MPTGGHCLPEDEPPVSRRNLTRHKQRVKCYVQNTVSLGFYLRMNFLQFDDFDELIQGFITHITITNVIYGCMFKFIRAVVHASVSTLNVAWTSMCSCMSYD